MIDIFIKSYYKDFKWLRYSIKSIAKFATGFNKVIILIPRTDLNDFNRLVEIPNGLNIEIHLLDEYGNRYLYQQWCKMNAHNYSKAEYIMFIDSDCIFYKPIDISKLVENKSKILYTDYSKVGDAICWKAPTENFMNEPQQYEFMRRNGLIYLRSSLETIHSLVPNLQDIIMNSERFSEFNAIGAWCFKNEKDKYNFVNTDNWEYEDEVVMQGWTWGDDDFNLSQQNKFKAILDENN